MLNHASALPLYRQAMEIRRTAFGEDHPNYAQSLSSLAGLYWEMGTAPPPYPSTARPWT